jgi:hypothetical protein
MRLSALAATEAHLRPWAQMDNTPRDMAQDEVLAIYTAAF